MRGAGIALGACGGLALGILAAKGPGGVDARLYWNTPTPLIGAARPESSVGAPLGAVEATGAEVGALHGAAEPSEEGIDVFPEGVPAEGSGPNAASEPPAAEDRGFPALPEDVQERFRRAWFNGEQGQLEVNVIESPTSANEAQPPENEGTTAEEGATYEAAPPVNEGEAEEERAPRNTHTEEPGPEMAPAYDTAGNHQGTDPVLDPFYQDAQRLRQQWVDQAEGRSTGMWRSVGSGGAWTGQATTGGAWTGGATTGAATTGGAWTGGATTGAATTGGAWTGGAWTGQATTGGAWTGGAWTGNVSGGGW